MKRRSTYREYKRVKPFEAPDGIVNVEIDPDSGKLAAVRVRSHAAGRGFYSRNPARGALRWARNTGGRMGGVRPENPRLWRQRG